MINWFDMPAEGLSNGGLFEVKELEVTENGTYETKGEMYNKVTVNVEGGGGSSDFSTAEVTIVNTSGVNAEFGNAVCIYEGNLDATAYFCGANKTVSDTFVLYKGSYNLYFSSQPHKNIVCTGGAEFDEQEEAIIITGDCTITIS